jgi:hypothetical protein
MRAESRSPALDGHRHLLRRRLSTERTDCCVTGREIGAEVNRERDPGPVRALSVRGAAIASEVRVLPRSVARGRGVVGEGDPARRRAENTIVQEIRDECLGAADAAPIVVP